VGNHVREGIVVKPLTERWSSTIGRVFLKQPGEGYLLRKTPEGEQEARLAEYKARTAPIIEAPGATVHGLPVSLWTRVKRYLGLTKA